MTGNSSLSSSSVFAKFQRQRISENVITPRVQCLTRAALESAEERSNKTTKCHRSHGVSQPNHLHTRSLCLAAVNIRCLFDEPVQTLWPLSTPPVVYLMKTSISPPHVHSRERTCAIVRLSKCTENRFNQELRLYIAGDIFNLLEPRALNVAKSQQPKLGRPLQRNVEHQIR